MINARKDGNCTSDQSNSFVRQVMRFGNGIARNCNTALFSMNTIIIASIACEAAVDTYEIIFATLK
jgi:hypothetical protein